jgi:transketolase
MGYGALGPSHFATEDLAIMRVLPNLTVVAPGDPAEVRSLVPQIVDRQGPAYLRLGRAGEKSIHDPGTRILLGEPALVRSGSDLLLLSTGGILPEVVKAADAIEAEGLSVQVASVHTLRPLAEEVLVEMASGFPMVVACEEHSVIGGLGGAVSEIFMEGGVQTCFRRFGLAPTFPDGIGSQEYLRGVNRIDAASLVALVLSKHPKA